MKLRAALAALVAVFALGAIGTSQASAAQQLNVSFDDAWIGLPALAAAGAGGFHALDPTDGKNLKINLTGDLAADGSFSAPASAFAFPTQVIDAGAPIGEINLDIVSRQNITGHYDRATGAFNANLSLRLAIVAPVLSLNCQLEPLNIPLATSGSYSFPNDPDPAVEKAGATFAGGSGAMLGSWTGVTVDNISEDPPNPDPEADVCKVLIGGIIANADPEAENPSFDGTIWLGGTANVTGQPDVTPGPGPTPTVKKAKITKVKVGNAKVKKGKKAKITIKVTNKGNAAFKGKIALKSNKKTVKIAKSVKINVPAGKTKAVKVVVKTTKKAKGKATITAKVGGKTGKGKVTVKK